MSSTVRWRVWGWWADRHLKRLSGTASCTDDSQRAYGLETSSTQCANNGRNAGHKRAKCQELPVVRNTSKMQSKMHSFCQPFFCTPRTRVECAQFSWTGTHDYVHAESAKVHATQARGCRRLQHVQPRSPSHFTQGRGDSARKSRTSRLLFSEDAR